LTWQEIIEEKLQNQKSKVVSINIDRKTISYSEKIKLQIDDQQIIYQQIDQKQKVISALIYKCAQGL
jgi:hypothetical protein